MRTVLSAHRAALSGSQTCSTVIAALSLLTLLHPAGAETTKATGHAAKVAHTDKRLGHAGKSRHRVSVGNATKPAQRTAAAREHDPGELLIPQGDGSPLLSVAANYLGWPYRFGSEGDAFDCSGFVRTVFADVGIDLPHSAREISALGDRVARDDLEPGDLVFFRNAGHHYATHVGIYVGDDKLVHAAARAGQVQVDSLSGTYYAQHYLCARRIEI